MMHHRRMLQSGWVSVLWVMVAAMWLPSASRLARADVVSDIRQSLANPAVTWIGSATSEGDGVMNADTARTFYGVDGSGVSVAVISDSFDGSGSTPTPATQIAAGDLPGPGNPNGHTTAVTVLNDDSGTDEGRAMSEIVHDVAPGATLYFHSAFNNTAGPAPSQSIADAISNSAAAVGSGGIVVDDVGYLTAARFQDGAAAQASDAAFGAGTAHFSSAGNADNDATRTSFAGGTGATVNWGTDDVLVVTQPGSTSRFTVQWDNPYTSVSGPGAGSDFAVDVTDTTGTTTYFTVDANGPTDDAYEFVGVMGSAGGSYGIRVRNVGAAASNDVVQVSAFGLAITDPDDTNSPTVYGHAAANGSEAVAAQYWGSPGTVESFSSRGPTDILFDTAGNPISDLRPTPDLTAPDGVTTTTSGFGSFYGTSAAAPHAAGVAALLQEHHLNLYGSMMMPGDIYDVLEASAVNIGLPGFDINSGYGLVDAMAALGAITPKMRVSNPAPAGSGALVDFGNVRIGTTSAPQGLEAENTGGSFSTLNGNFGSPSGGLPFAGGGSAFALGPGDAQTENYTFSPTAHGTATDVVSITSNAFSAPTIINTNASLDLQGVGVGPEYGSAPFAPGDLLDFGLVALGDTASLPLSVSNVSPDVDLGTLTDLSVLGISTTDPQFSFSIAGGASPLAVGDALALLLEFTPINLGLQFASLDILTDVGSAFGVSGDLFRYSLEGIGVAGGGEGQGIPEPATVALLLAALLALMVSRRHCH